MTESIKVPTWKRIFFIVFRLLFGAVFMFSGFVKGVDPLGTMYKIQDYLEVWHFGGLYHLAFIASLALSAIEFTIGFTMFFGIRVKIFAYLGLAFMLIMTPLTLWIALKNPVTDCGCFGDALVISNTATFLKNVVLLTIILFIFCWRHIFRPWVSPLPSWLITAVAFSGMVLISILAVNHLPMIDFRPYKIGSDIKANMQIPANAPEPQYKVSLVYEKNGIKKNFTMQNCPYNDSTWHFVSQKSVLIKKGYIPPIHDFTITTQDGDDITDSVLASQNITFIAVMYDLKLTDTAYIQDVARLCDYVRQNGCLFYALTASDWGSISQFESKYQTPYQFCTTDPITLKTIVRANPGIFVLKSGVVIDKWNVTDQKQALKKLMRKIRKHRIKV